VGICERLVPAVVSLEVLMGCPEIVCALALAPALVKQAAY
jgi:hypothetical protein